MAKRKLIRNVKEPNRRAHSVSDTDSESERPLKQLKSGDSSTEINVPSSPLSSTLKKEQSMSDMGAEIGLELSDYEQDEGHYESFTSFMQLNSFASGSEDEDSMVSHKKDRSLKNRQPPVQYYASKKQQSARDSILNTSRNSGSALSTHSENIMVLPCPSQQIELVALKPGDSVTLFGYVRVSVLVGSVSILGYRVKEGNSVKVFSTEGTNLKKATALESIHKLSFEELSDTICQIIACDNRDIDFINHISSTTVVLLLERCFLPPALQFLELYCPRAVRDRWDTKTESSLSNTQDEYALDVSENDTQLALEINKNIKISMQGDINLGSRILIFGERKSGKSTTLRFLINSLLKKKRMIYYLDTDPGQTEFTPPGVVSLTKVETPVFGPAFSQQRKPVKMIFTGSTTAETSPPMYLKSIQNLVDVYNMECEKDILFVNTMGWLKGIGGICFRKIIKMVKPTMIIEIANPEECPSFTIDKLEEDVIKFTIPSRSVDFRSSSSQTENQKYVTPTDMRTFALLSYLGQCQKYYREPLFINEFRPVSVCWDNIAIYVIGKKVPQYRLIEAIHCSVVALCHVDESFILESGNADFPRTLSDEPDNECIGYGIVRATDEANHILHIVTPLGLGSLRRVNALIKGNVILPDELLRNQNILDVALAYTDQSADVPISRKKVKERSHRSFTHTPSKIASKKNI